MQIEMTITFNNLKSYFSWNHEIKKNQNLHRLSYIYTSFTNQLLCNLA